MWTGSEFEREWAKLRVQFHELIATAGQAVQIVYLTKFDRPGSLPFMYMIGNHAHGLPKFLVVGTDDHGVAGILNRLGYMQRERAVPFADEERVSLGGQFPLRIVDAGSIGRTKYATFAGIYYDTQDYEVRQMLLPDPQGRWPDMPGCALPYAEQPILSKIRGPVQ